jgi:hypothetical protein
VVPRLVGTTATASGLPPAGPLKYAIWEDKDPEASAQFARMILSAREREKRNMKVMVIVWARKRTAVVGRMVIGKPKSFSSEVICWKTGKIRSACLIALNMGLDDLKELADCNRSYPTYISLA